MKQTYPKVAKEFLKLLKSDTQKFNAKISHSGEYSPYADIPILNSISPEIFVNMWLSIPDKQNWRRVKIALEERYENEKLTIEKPWTEEVCRILKQTAKEHEGLTQYRIIRLIPKITKK